MSRSCPSCGAPDYGTPFCVSCQRPMSPVDSAAVAAAEVRAVQQPEIVKTGFFRRFAAFFIDWILLSVIADIVRFAYQFGSGTEPGMLHLNIAMSLSGVLFILYFTLLTGEGGQTLGKMLLGIRVIMEDGSRIGYGRSFIRSLGYIVSIFFGSFLGFLWALWDRKNQTWHDKIAGTIVIRV